MTPLDKWLEEVKQRLEYTRTIYPDVYIKDFLDLERAVKVIEVYEWALQKIEDPRKRDHREPDAYTTLGCVMNIATEALAEVQKIVDGE